MDVRIGQRAQEEGRSITNYLERLITEDALRKTALTICYHFCYRTGILGPTRLLGRLWVWVALKTSFAKHSPTMLLALFRGASLSADRSHIAVGVTWAVTRHGI